MANRKAQQGAQFPDMFCVHTAGSLDSGFPPILRRGASKDSGTNPELLFKAMGSPELFLSWDQTGLKQELQLGLEEYCKNISGCIISLSLFCTKLDPRGGAF